MPSLRGAFRESWWLGRLGGGRSAHLTAVSATTHSRASLCTPINAAVSQRSTIVAGAGANVGYQLPREPSIVPYLVKLELALSASPCGAPSFQIRTESDRMRLKHQPRWSPHALSNSADATSTVSLGQATASSNAFVGATDPMNPLTRTHWG
jgi:hypothetical protein